MFVRSFRRLSLPLAAVSSLFAAEVAHAAPVTPLTLAIAVSSAPDEGLAEYYRSVDYAPLWVGVQPEYLARREALLAIAGSAAFHALPGEQYDAERLRARMATARTERQRGGLDVDLSRLFLRLAADLRIGILDPGATVPAIKRERRGQDQVRLLRDFAAAQPHAFMRSLVPSGTEYARLAREKVRLSDSVRRHDWGAALQVPRLEQGAAGSDVVALRDRLAGMGYLDGLPGDVFDLGMRLAVRAFQADHGLAPDGIVGGRTLSELNIGPERRLGRVIVAMERERWMNTERGETHVWVNLTDFHARILRDEDVLFETRSIVGRADQDRQTPEFSDVMEHMVLNPSWYVPRSIVVEEYLPSLRSNPYAHGELQVIDRLGREVSRARGFGQYTSRTFPYSMRQPPGPDNALGRVKFMFPNHYNIYLHDTPAQHLFSQTVRAYSHGCIRLDDPEEFAHALLSLQSDDPEGEFHRRLATGRSSRIELDAPFPVHLVYRTAFTKPDGGMHYRDDIYGRDARILSALMAEGVSVPGLDRRLALSDLDG